MNNFSFTRCIGNAWNLTIKNWIMCIVVLVIIIISRIIGNIGTTMVVITTDMTPQDMTEAYLSTLTGGFSAMTILSIIITLVLFAGVYRMAINGCNGEKADTRAYDMPLSTYIKFVCGLFVYGILEGIGLLLCIIPGIIVIVRFIFIPVIILDDPEIEFIDAFKKSWNMTSGNFWNLFGLGMMAVLINFAGILCCCVGYLFTSVMTIFMMVIAYQHFKKNDETDSEIDFI